MFNLAACSSIGRKNLEGNENIQIILEQAESNASNGGRKILEVSTEMIANKEIFVGGCWNYINAVYDKAGYSSKLRNTIYKSKYTHVS